MLKDKRKREMEWQRKIGGGIKRKVITYIHNDGVTVPLILTGFICKFIKIKICLVSCCCFFFPFLNQHKQVYYQKGECISLCSTLLTISNNINTCCAKKILRNYKIHLNSRLSVLMQYREKNRNKLSPLLSLSGNI